MDPALLSMTEAHFLNVAHTITYVGLLYTSQSTRLPYSNPERYPDGWRNDPAVIKARLLVAAASTLLSCAAMYGIIDSKVERSSGQLLKTLGFAASSQNIIAFFVTPSLFLGPLYAMWLGKDLPLMSNWTFETHLRDKIFTWQGARNFIFGPITEELVWRSCVIAGYYLAGASRFRLIFLTPLSFGAAHLHHGYEIYKRYGGGMNGFKMALATTLFQFTYTTLFGFHCAFLFLRTGSVLVPITAHIFCNVMGVPELPRELRRFPAQAGRIKLFYILGILAYVYTMSHWTLRPSNDFWILGSS